MKNNIIQPTALTYARYDFTIYEQRILVRILECFQDKYREALKSYGQTRLKKDLQISNDLFGGKVITIAAKSLLPPGNRNYKYVRQALKSLRNRSVDVRSCNEEGQYISYTGLILKADYKFNSQEVKIYICHDVAPFYRDLTRGFTKFDAAVVFMLSSPYTVRFVPKNMSLGEKGFL